MNKTRYNRLVIPLQILLFLLAGSLPNYAQLPAFPGAEGFGRFAEGGRGGDVYIVTNLNDSGEGSLRHGIETAMGPRTIVFGLSGLVRLKSELVVNKDHITIAGQTSPGDGICLADAPLVIYADHVVVRYIRSRLGDEGGMEADAISISGGKNVIIDHCSASWSVDECLSCSTMRKNQIDKVTVQWCIISESLNNSIHKKGEHGYGALIRGCYGAKYTYHHNLFAHNVTRNPRPGNYDINNHERDPEGLLFDFRNNVMYNWAGERPGYDADKESVCHFNYVGNYGKPGPNSGKKGFAYEAGCKYFKAYFEGNHFFGKSPENQYSLVKFGGNWSKKEIAAWEQDVSFPAGEIETETALEAFEHVIASSGASLVRDAVDKRVMTEVETGTGSIINSQTQVGGWPEYKTYNAKIDSDKDGMPDEWEKKNGLNPQNPEDRNRDANNDGYTNLEEYLNEIVMK